MLPAAASANLMSSHSTLEREFCLHTQPPSIHAKTENQAIIAVVLL